MAVKLDTTKTTVCKVISSSMFHRNEQYLKDVDWKAVYVEMYEQAIQGLVLHMLPDLPMPDDFRKSWRTDCYQLMNTGMRLRYEQANFLSILEKAKIPYVILKGTAAAMYYPDPLLRAMGDVDVYVPLQYHEKVIELLLAEDYELENKEDHNKHSNRLYNRHITFTKNQTEFEVHSAYATINSPKEWAYVDGLLEDCCNNELNIEKVVWDGVSYNVPSRNINGIVLLEHIGHHMLGGLGFRQIIDWMMFVNTSLHDEQWITFSKMAQSAGLETLAKTVTKMCVKYLGLQGEYEWCMSADDDASDGILEYLFENGNFGSKMKDTDQVIVVAGRFKRTRNTFATLQATGEHNWALYKRHRWLKPFAWIYQIFRYAGQIFITPGMLKKFSKGTSEVAKRSELMKNLDIYMKL